MASRSDLHSQGTVFTEIEVEILRAKAEEDNYDVRTESRYYSYLVLSALLLVNISVQWSKFIIGAAYNYQGEHTGPKWNITEAFNFSYTQYTMVSGVFYSLTYGFSAKYT